MLTQAVKFVRTHGLCFQGVCVCKQGLGLTPCVACFRVSLFKFRLKATLVTTGENEVTEGKI